MTGRRRGRARAGLSLAVALSAVALALAVAVGAPAGGRSKPRPSPTPAGPTGAASMAPPSAAPGEGAVSGRVAVSSITIDVQLSQPAVKAGQSVQVRVTVANQTSSAVSNVSISLVATPRGVDLRPVQGRETRRIVGGAHETVTWIACASAPGTYSFVASGAVGGTIVTSTPIQLLVRPGRIC